MLLIHIIFLLLSILGIDSSNRLTNAEKALGKIISYAVFLSYYICSGMGTSPIRGIIGSVFTWGLLLVLGYNYSGEQLYWGKFTWYGIMWAYAFSTYPINIQYIPMLMVSIVLLLVNTPSPWMIHWPSIGSPNTIGMFLLNKLYTL
jgi:hypothetical protein